MYFTAAAFQVEICRKSPSPKWAGCDPSVFQGGHEINEAKIKAEQRSKHLLSALLSSSHYARQKIAMVVRQPARTLFQSVARHGFHDGIYSRLHSENRTLSLRDEEKRGRRKLFKRKFKMSIENTR